MTRHGTTKLSGDSLRWGNDCAASYSCIQRLQLEQANSHVDEILQHGTCHCRKHRHTFMHAHVAGMTCHVSTMHTYRKGIQRWAQACEQHVPAQRTSHACFWVLAASHVAVATLRDTPHKLEQQRNNNRQCGAVTSSTREDIGMVRHASNGTWSDPWLHVGLRAAAAHNSAAARCQLLLLAGVLNQPHPLCMAPDALHGLARYPLRTVPQHAARWCRTLLTAQPSCSLQV